ncbi:hypothetical protein N9L26_02735 [Candidatus Pacebacteria bacterium]|nr:hypothetical protein [Candidatus Paceibacterota bacterium]
MNIRPNVNCFTWYAPYPSDVMGLMDGIGRPDHKSIFWGDLTISCGKVTVLKEPIEPVTILRVFSRAGVLAHEQSANPHFEDTNTWIGADGAGLLWQDGRHQASKKSQLFRLRPGENILLVDARKEVTKLTAGGCGARPDMVRATEGEVADYVLGEARQRGENPSTRTWCFHALKELGCQAQLDSFHQLFPSFHSA